MRYDGFALLLAGYLVGLFSAWALIRWGFKLGAKTLYEQKEGLPPDSDRAVAFEQALTEAEAEPDIER